MAASLLTHPAVCFVIALLASCCLRQGSGTGLQHFVERPKSVSALEGEDVLLRCVVAGQQGRVQWTKDGFALGFERHVPGYPRYTYLGDARLGQHHLAISQVSLTDDGEYQCQVGPTLNSPPIWAAANVTVLLAPSRVSLDGHRDGSVVEVADGSLFTLRCSVLEAHPPPTILWYLAGTQVEQDQVQTQMKASSVAGRWDVVSQVVLRPGAEDDGHRVTCRALHPGVAAGVTLTSSVTLSIRHEPGVPEVSGFEPDDTLRLGEQRSLICRVEGGNPAPALLWYREGHLVDDTYGREQTGSRVTVNALRVVGREDEDGVKYECRATSSLLAHSLVATVTLAVHYGPDSVEVTGPEQVEEGGIISLRCHTTKANPPATLRWLVNGKAVTSPGSVVSRVSSGGWVSSSQLVWAADNTVQAGEVVVECRAAHPALPHHLHNTRIITIVKEAGSPVLEGEVMREVMSGSSVELQCASSGVHSDATIRIYKNGQAMATTMKTEGNITRGRSQVRVTPADNGAEVKCEVSSQAARKSKVTTTRLSVLFGPRDISVSATPNPAEEGSLVSLKCRTSSSHPAVNLTWTSLGSELPISNTHVAPAAFGGFSTRSELQLRVTPKDNERTFQCNADNGLASPLQKEVILRVLHAPVWQSKPEPQVDVWEGSDVVITATATANPGPVRYWWRRGLETLVAAGGTLSLGPADRSMTGNYTISAYTGRGAINTTFFLNVQYGPENFSAPERVVVSDGERVIIKCSAMGEPVPHLMWIYRNRTLGSGVGTAMLVMSSVRPEDSGVYHCVAASSPSDTPLAVETKLIVKQSVRVSREMDEGKVSWVSVGGNGRLACHVKAHPPPSFTWTSQDGTIIHNDDKYIIHEPVCVDGVASWVSVLEVVDVTPADYRAYYCSATNNLGSDSTKIVLRPPSRPLPPTDLTVIKVTNVTVTLGWAANSAGGRPEGYTVKYRATGTLNYQYEDVMEGNKTQVTVEGLQPGQEYSITTQATNSHGNSDYAIPALTFTSLGGGGVGSSDGGSGGINSGEGSSHVTSLLFLVIVLAAIALLALNIIVATCLLRHFRKKRSSIKSSGSTKTTSVTTHVNTSSSSPEIHHHHHHQARAPLSRVIPISTRKVASHKNSTSAADANLVSSASTSINKNKATTKGRQKKQARTKIRAITALLHNDKTTQQGQKYIKTKKTGISLNTKEYIPRYGNAANSSITKSPLLISAEAKSLIQYDQGGNLPISTYPQNTDPDDDQASESSHESTETAIYCDNIPPPPGLENYKPYSQTNDGYNVVQHAMQAVENQHILMDSEHNHILQEQNPEMDEEIKMQHKELPEKSAHSCKEIEQAMIMTELQNAISQRIQQSHPQIQISEDHRFSTVNEQPLSPQETSQPSFQEEYSRSANKSKSHRHASSSISSVPNNIPVTGRVLQLGKLNGPSSLTPRCWQQSQPAESHNKLHYSSSITSPAKEHMDKLMAPSPVKARRQYQSAKPSTMCHEVQHESVVNDQHKIILPSPKTTKHHFISYGLPTRTQNSHSRHSSPVKKQLNISPKSTDQFRHSNSHSTVPHHSAPPTDTDHYSQIPKQFHYSDSHSKQQHITSSAADKSSQSTLSPLSTIDNQQSPQDSREHNSSHLHHQPVFPPSAHCHILHTPSSGHPQPPSTPTPPNQHILPPSTPPIQTHISTSHNFSSQYSPSSSPNTSQRLPPIPFKSIHHRPPPTPPRLRHQRPSSSVMTGLPPTGQSTSGQDQHSSSTMHIQTSKSTHSRQQSRSMVFRKSISRSLEDSSSKAAIMGKKQHYNNTATTQKNSKSMLKGSSAISVSLPKNMDTRENNMIQTGPYTQRMVQPVISLHSNIQEDISPAATSSPITNRRRSRFPDDFLWQGSQGK